MLEYLNRKLEIGWRKSYAKLEVTGGGEQSGFGKLAKQRAIKRWKKWENDTEISSPIGVGYTPPRLYWSPDLLSPDYLCPDCDFRPLLTPVPV